MRTSMIRCIQCERDKTDRLFVVKSAELRDDLSYEITCPNNHRTRLIYEVQKFEILFDMGISALIDGYGREAVTSFAAAQERFHEFCIKVFLHQLKVEGKDVAATWKLVSNQSERQLGAFYFLHLALIRTVPIPDNKKVEFRNNVIHKGTIASTEDAKKYAAFVYDYIIRVVKEMKLRFPDSVRAVWDAEVAQMKASVPKDMMYWSGAIPTMIHLSAPEGKFGTKSFAEALSEQKEDHLIELRDRLEDLEEEVEVGSEEEAED